MFVLRDVTRSRTRSPRQARTGRCVPPNTGNQQDLALRTLRAAREAHSVALGTNDPLLAAAVTAIHISPRLYACRDAARWLLGDHYRQRMSELGNALMNTANAANCDVLQAATDAARGTEG